MGKTFDSMGKTFDSRVCQTSRAGWRRAEKYARNGPQMMSKLPRQRERVILGLEPRFLEPLALGGIRIADLVRQAAATGAVGANGERGAANSERGAANSQRGAAIGRTEGRANVKSDGGNGRLPRHRLPTGCGVPLGAKKKEKKS